MVLSSFTDLAIGVLVFALAAPAIAAAHLERPPVEPIGNAFVILAAAWTTLFGAGAVLAVLSGSFAAAGLIGAAAELTCAALVWASRSRPRTGYSEAYWAYWEAQFEEGDVF